MMKNGKEWDFVISEEGELKNTFDIFNDLSNVLINTCFFWFSKCLDYRITIKNRKLDFSIF